MNALMPHRGSKPVGLISDLDPIEAGAVLYLRLWCQGPERQSETLRDFEAALGRIEAGRVVKSFQTLCDLCVRHGRRPLLSHAVQCKYIGSDEACFANFVGYASEGDREDAFLIASYIVRPDVAQTLVGLATDFGLGLRQMAIKARRIPETPRTLH